MSDIPQDGGARAPPSLRTPRDIVAGRLAREARRKEEAEELRDQGRRRVEAESRAEAERRAATERRAAANSSATQRFDTEAAASSSRIQEDLRASAPARQRPQPQSQSQSQSQPQQQQTLPKAQTMPGHRRSQTASGMRQSSAPTPHHSVQQPESESMAEERPQRGNTSTFPHAFERWEQLSSHWEGLTSYWLRKLESNTEDFARNNPTVPALSRQIQDLSAAGANLFHAVVELQRLRASSERKFQRWFFETRAEQERSQEAQAGLAELLQNERDAKEQAIAAAEKADLDKRSADRKVSEMSRELQISKAEARRAWEDLGRMEAEQRTWITNLRQGLPTVIGGVQVLPTASTGGVSHQSSERRPTTSEGPRGRGMQNPAAEQGESEPSPTNTDPFMESDQPLHHEPDVRSFTDATYQPYPPGSTPASTSTARTAISPRQGRRSLTPTTRPPGFTITSHPVQYDEPAIAGSSHDPPEMFYQQPPGKVYLHSSAAAPESGIPTVPEAPQAPHDLQSRPSYESGSTEGTEYEIDENGEVRRDSEGRPVVFRQASRARAASHDSDDYDVEADVARERELAARYGLQHSQAPATSAEAMATFVASAAASPGGYSSIAPADYEGAGYGNWESLQSRHHHPTRLSDVLEEDERSRTTGE